MLTTYSRTTNERSAGLDLMPSIGSSPPSLTRGPGMPGIFQLDAAAGPILFSADGHHLRATFTQPNSPSSSTNASTPQPLSRSNSLNSTVLKPSRSSTRLQKSGKHKENAAPYAKPKGARSGRAQSALTMKQRALKIKSTGKLPATEHQRRVMLMVYEEITPYPDEDWISIVSVLVNREYHQVKNWFSNQRQKDSRAYRENADASSSSSPPASDLASLRKVDCGGRQLRLRPTAQKCAEAWTDSLLEEIVMIHNFRTLIQLRREQTAGVKRPFGTIIHDI